MLLPDFVVAALRDQRDRQLVRSLHDLVFTTPRGEPVRHDGFYSHTVVPMLERAELRPVRFHDLRHSAVTLLLRAGVATEVVSSLVGHYSPGFTLATYRHNTTSRKLPLNIRGMLQLFKNKGKRYGSGTRERIADRDNPFGSDDQYVSVYRGWLYCPVGGKYRIAVDSDDAAFVQLDGRECVSFPRAHNFDRVPWQHARDEKLTAGLLKL